MRKSVFATSGLISLDLPTGFVASDGGASVGVDLLTVPGLDREGDEDAW